MVDLAELITNEVFDNSRRFLPGRVCTREDFSHNLGLPILVDGLTREETLLALSTLPRGANSLSLAPLDKGLSASKVFAAKFDAGNRRVSKVFVMKLGARNKIAREAEALETLVAVTLPGSAPPVYRLGPNIGVVVQDLAGLTPSAKLTSFRHYSRTSPRSDQIIFRLFRERFRNWYFSEDETDPVTVRLSDAFARYLAKSGGGALFPEGWSELKQWVQEESGHDWSAVRPAYESALNHTVLTPSCIVHGDLHSQNILVDDNEECWPIDFAWCHENATPLVDLVMLECSLKFLAIPRRSDLRVLIRIEVALAQSYRDVPSTGNVPYRDEIANVLRALAAVREVAATDFGFAFGDYQRALFLMNYALVNHPQLNRPYALASLQIHAGELLNNGRVLTA